MFKFSPSLGHKEASAEVPDRNSEIGLDGSFEIKRPKNKSPWARNANM